MPPGQTRLNAFLALTRPEPVQCGVQIVFVGALDAKLRSERGLAQQPPLAIGTGAKTRWTISATARSRSRIRIRPGELQPASHGD